MNYQFSVSQIDKIFDWVQANKLRLESFKTFENAAKAAALECFKEAFPGTDRIKEIIFYLKQYKPAVSETCSVCNGSGKIIAFGVSLPVARPKAVECQVCNGGGKDLSKGAIQKSLAN